MTAVIEGIRIDALRLTSVGGGTNMQSLLISIKYFSLLLLFITVSNSASANEPESQATPVAAPPPLSTTSTSNSVDFNDKLREGDSSKTNTASLVDQVRNRISKDTSVSTYAERITIIPEGNKLILQGPVLSSLEKLAIEKAAIDVVGQGNIRSELVIVQ